jgi:tRNA(Glu) U13 pseudouridine synthase TruD
MTEKVLKSRSVGISEMPLGSLGVPNKAEQDVHNVLAKPKQVSVNEAVTKAGDLPPQKSKKQVDKEAEQEKRYWNGMISRGEVQDMINRATSQIDDRLRMLFISTSTMMNFLLQRGLATTEELDAISKPIVMQLYGMSEEQYEEQRSTQRAREQEALAKQVAEDVVDSGVLAEVKPDILEDDAVSSAPTVGD